MTEREKVINNLEYHIHLLYDVIPHVSRDDGEYLEATAKTMSDAIILLKAQEPRLIKNSAGNGICPGCEHIIPAWSSPNYCGYCGQAVKWK